MKFFAQFWLTVGGITDRSVILRAASSKSAISRTALILGGNLRVSRDIIQFSRADSSVEESFRLFG